MEKNNQIGEVRQEIGDRRAVASTRRLELPRSGRRYRRPH